MVQLYRDGKSYREIARIARISVRDIKPILQKYGAENLSRYSDIDYSIEDTAAAAVLPNSTKAYKLFSEGKSPLQVSIALNLRAPEVKTLYKEFWELRRMHTLAKTYDEIGDNGISSLLQIHRSCKVQHISNEQVIEYLRIYGNDLALVKQQYDEVDVRLQGLLSQKYRTEKELQDLHTSIRYSFDMLKSIQAQCAEAEKERNELLRQKLLIESRITCDLIQRGFVIPVRTKTISKHHEQMRTLEDIVEFDKAGMIVSPEIGLHENVAVLDLNDEYANLILNHNISYETVAPTVTRNQTALLPSIIEELVSRRVHFEKTTSRDSSR